MVATQKYDLIRELKREYGLNIPDLLALARNNDPYNIGGPTDIALAEWFYNLWQAHSHSAGTHLRRIHYRAAVPGDVRKLDGTLYENIYYPDWCYLLDAARCARALGLVDAADFDDHRNPDPILAPFASPEYPNLEVWIPNANDWVLPQVAKLQRTRFTVPKPSITGGFDPDDNYDRPFLLEIWIEKSTQDDVLRPLCARLGVNLVPAAGTQSITAAVKLLYRCVRYRKRARVLYISDFDPAGVTMPTSVARQVQFYRDWYAPHAEIKLKPLALTLEQIEQYDLPRMPIDPEDRRAAKFEAAWGRGATELDALKALHPGELERIVREAVRPYRDPTIRARVSEAGDENEELIQATWKKQTRAIRAKLAAINRDINATTSRLQPRLAALEAELQRALAPQWDALKLQAKALAEARRYFTYDPIERPEPEYSVPDESDWLFDSGRGYMEQLEFYNARKRGE